MSSSSSTDTGKVMQEKAIIMFGATIGGMMGMMIGTGGESRMSQKVGGFVGGLVGGAAGKGWYRAASGQSYFTSQFVADHLEAGYVGFLVA